LTRCAIKHPAETSDPDQVQALGRAVLKTGGEDAPTAPLPGLRLVNDETAGVYEATVGDARAGGVTYNVVGDDRVILLAVSVFPEFRGRGISSELIRAVLGDVRAQGKKITNYCPVVNTFIEQNSEYADLIDRKHPGSVTHHRP